MQRRDHKGTMGSLKIEVNLKNKYKEYKNLDQLKMDRDNLSYQATHEDSLRYKAYERMREEKERERLEKLREQEERHERQFRKLNQKLLVHK